MSDIQVSKSILAKLLASENLNISHEAGVQTAYFDLNTRTLVCPVWKDMDGALYDLLMGHEVGHALETPKQGWHDALHDNKGNKVSQKFKSFLNVIEDARIEKKIKRKFPGLSKSFATAYKGLYERDFFGIKNLDIEKLNFIDRINIRFKMGAHIPVPFNDAERAIVQEIENVETWEQVVDIAKRVFDLVKKDDSKIQNMSELQEAIKEMLNQEQDDSSESGEEESDDSEEYDGEDDTSDYEDIDGSDAQSQQQKESDEEQETENDSATTADAGEESEQDDDPQSITDRIFRQRESELINQTGKVYMIELPEANLNNILLSNKIVCDDLEQFIRVQISRSSVYQRTDTTFDKLLTKCLHKFNRNNKKYISHLAREFDMRKKASQYARQQTARTGELNMNVLHKYKFSNDLFRKITVVPKGKNHGMVMFIDMSGSMSDILRNTVEQVLVLVSFCKMVGIPYDVYGFSDDYYHSKTENSILTSAFEPVNKKFVNTQDADIHCSGYHLKHLIGSSLSPTQHRRAFNLLCVVVNEYLRGHDYRNQEEDQDFGHFDSNWENAGFGLNGTPFIQTLLASREIITKFRAAHKLDITNVVYLTDGEGSGGLQHKNIPYHEIHRSVVYYIDKKTKKRIRLDGNKQQQAITQLIRDVTDCKHIGYFLMDLYAAKNIWREFKYRDMNQWQINKLKKSFRENKFIALPTLGYDNYFYIAASNNKITEEQMEIKEGMSKSKLANEFSKMVRSKSSNRRLVSNFAEDLAVA